MMNPCHKELLYFTAPQTPIRVQESSHALPYKWLVPGDATIIAGTDPSDCKYATNGKLIVIEQQQLNVQRLCGPK